MRFLYDDIIIDTTLMLVIDCDYMDKLGYEEENRYNPEVDQVYLATKKFTNDREIRKNNGR